MDDTLQQRPGARPKAEEQATGASREHDVYHGIWRPHPGVRMFGTEKGQ